VLGKLSSSTAEHHRVQELEGGRVTKKVGLDILQLRTNLTLNDI
jgi:hypothetical protein